MNTTRRPIYVAARDVRIAAIFSNCYNQIRIDTLYEDLVLRLSVATSHAELLFDCFARHLEKHDKDQISGENNISTAVSGKD